MRLLGTGIVGSDGKQRINSRLAAVIDVDANDTLNDIAQKINAAGANATASVIDDGSAFNSARLSLTGHPRKSVRKRSAVGDSARRAGLSR